MVGAAMAAPVKLGLSATQEGPVDKEKRRFRVENVEKAGERNRGVCPVLVPRPSKLLPVASSTVNVEDLPTPEDSHSLPMGSLELPLPTLGDDDDGFAAPTSETPPASMAAPLPPGASATPFEPTLQSVHDLPSEPVLPSAPSETETGTRPSTSVPASLSVGFYGPQAPDSPDSGALKELSAQAASPASPNAAGSDEASAAGVPSASGEMVVVPASAIAPSGTPSTVLTATLTAAPRPSPGSAAMVSPSGPSPVSPTAAAQNRASPKAAPAAQTAGVGAPLSSSKKVRVRLTFYSGQDDQWGSRVAWDKVVQARLGRTVAADPTLFPYGTWIHIPGFGKRRVEDTGTAVKARTASASGEPVIDVYVGSEAEVARLAACMPEYVEILPLAASKSRGWFAALFGATPSLRRG